MIDDNEIEDMHRRLNSVERKVDILNLNILNLSEQLHIIKTFLYEKGLSKDV